jgi:hypothetical protein
MTRSFIGPQNQPENFRDGNAENRSCDETVRMTGWWPILTGRDWKLRSALASARRFPQARRQRQPSKAMYKIIGGDGKEYGPVAAEQLRQWLAQGRVNGQTKARLDGATDWQPLSSIAEFAGACTPPPVLPPPRQGGDSLNKVIPYRNVPALVGYYCGVFSLIPFLGVILGLAGLALGIIGLRVARQNPAAGGKVHAWVGIILGGLCGFGYLALVAWMVAAASHH